MTEVAENRKTAGWNAWDWAYWLLVLVVTVWAGYEANFEYFAGARNRGQASMDDMGWMLMGCMVWFVPGVMALLMAVMRRCSAVRKLFYAGLAALPLMLGFGWHFVSGNGAVRYQAGFAEVD